MGSDMSESQFEPFRREGLAVVRKVPEVGIVFWIIKLLSTALGEATSDFMVYQIDPYVAVILGCLVFGVALALQLGLRRYVAWVYWLAVAMVAVFGTMAADVTHVVLGVPYLVSTTVFSILLAGVFTVWYLKERNLSIHTVTAGRRELFYWATVIAAFALGTAAGDMTAATLRLGYPDSFWLFAVLFALPLVARRLFGLNEIFSFWFAYVVTRPLGASFADWMSKPFLGGLGLGDGRVAVVLWLLFIGFVVYGTARDRRATRDRGERPNR